MFLTTRGRYAVTAILDMLVSGNGTPVTLASIAERQGISISYLEQIFLLLKKHNIVQSVRGPGGGYIIKHNPMDVNLVQILYAAGESIKMTRCTGDKTCTGTSDRCATHNMWQACEDKIVAYLSSITLQDLLAYGQQNQLMLKKCKI